MKSKQYGKKYGKSPSESVLDDYRLINKLLKASIQDIFYAPFRCKLMMFEEEELNRA